MENLMETLTLFEEAKIVADKEREKSFSSYFKEKWKNIH